jgi:hypothetical protein
MIRPAHGGRDEHPQQRKCASEYEHPDSAVGLIQPPATPPMKMPRNCELE